MKITRTCAGVYSNNDYSINRVEIRKKEKEWEIKFDNGAELRYFKTLKKAKKFYNEYLN